MSATRWLVRLPTWLGDTLMALPALHAVARLSDKPLLLWGPPGREALLAHAGLRNAYLPYRRRRPPAGISDAIHGCAALLHEAADAALLLPNAFEPALLAWAAGIPRRVGYATDARGALLTDVVPEPTRPRHVVHEAERFARLAEHVGGTVDTTDARLIATPELHARAAELLPGERPWLGLAPGSANAPAKRWPVTSYAELARRARAKLGAGIVLLGAAADLPLHAALNEALEGDCVDLGGCDLTDLMAALTRCRVVVGNDSGAAHLAAALERPTVVLFGPTDPQRSAPVTGPVTPLQAGSFCQPCGYRHCPLDHRCMLDLEAGHVLAAVAEQWDRSS